MMRDPKTEPIPAPEPATPTVAAPAPMYLAAESMSITLRKGKTILDNILNDRSDVYQWSTDERHDTNLEDVWKERTGTTPDENPW